MPLDANDPNHLELPDGGWADLYDGAKIPEKRRRPVQRAALVMQRSMPEQEGTTVTVTREAPAGEAVPSMGAPPIPEGSTVEVDGPRTVRVQMKDITTDGLDAIDAFNDSVVLAFTREWSFGEVTADALVDLAGDAYDQLLAECQRRNNGGGAKVVGSAAESPDAADPTLPSGA